MPWPAGLRKKWLRPTDLLSQRKKEKLFDKAETDGFQIAKVIRSRTFRSTYVADDGRRFSDQSSRRSGLKAGDLVELKVGFVGSKRLVRRDGFQVKVKEVTR
jgi:hypothetical protein